MQVLLNTFQYCISSALLEKVAKLLEKVLMQDLAAATPRTGKLRLAALAGIAAAVYLGAARGALRSFSPLAGLGSAPEARVSADALSGESRQGPPAHSLGRGADSSRWVPDPRASAAAEGSAPAMRLAALYRYPVKSGRAEALRAETVTVEGIAGDRQFLVARSDGSFLTQRELPALATLEARVAGTTRP